MDLFVMQDNEVIVNKVEVLLIPEFAKLWSIDFNKCKDNKDGRKRLIAYKYFTYIFLMYDWTSPYEVWAEDERRQYIMEELELTKKDIECPELRCACDKYIKLQTSIKLELLKSAKKAARQLILFFDSFSFSEMIAEDGRPIYTPKDIINNLKDVGKAVDGLDALIEQVKKEKEAEGQLRGGVSKGAFD